MVLVPLIGVLTGIGFAALGMWFATMVSTFDGFSYVISGVITPLFLVAGTFFPLNRMPQWLQSLAQLNPLYHCVELVRHCAFGLDPAGRSGARGRAVRVRGPGLVARGVADAGEADRLSQSGAATRHAATTFAAIRSVENPRRCARP